jgi:hypothetical protein
MAAINANDPRDREAFTMPVTLHPSPPEVVG